MNYYIKYSLNIFDKVICIICKAFISLSLEIIINNKDKLTDISPVTTLLKDYLYAGLELKTPQLLTNELYIFGLMASLITSMKYLGKQYLKKAIIKIKIYNASPAT